MERHIAICRMVGYEASPNFCIDMGDLLKYHYQGFNLDHFEAHMPEPPQNQLFKIKEMLLDQIALL